MNRLGTFFIVMMLISCACAASFALAWTGAAFQEPAQKAIAKRIGAIKSIGDGAITLSPDSGADVAVTVSGSTRILRIAPGEKNLSNATPVQFRDLQVGDRILVGGKAGEDGSIAASSIVVMKASDVQARLERERRDWQKRGVGGLVSSVDSATGIVRIAVNGFGGVKTIIIHSGRNTVIRRYAPGSLRFEDAKPSTLPEIHPGDQLRARGDRISDGSELAAEEIVTGSFRNIAGTISLVDAGNGTLGVQDLITKHSLQVKITAESQLHKLPPELAQRLAIRLKGGRGGTPGSTSPGNTSAPRTSPATGAAGDAQDSGAGGSWGGQGARSTDFQQVLSRTPSVALSDLHKGDAVMIVATEGTSGGEGTVITLISGVEPILEAAPNAGQSMMLGAWSLSASGGDAASE